LLRQARSSPQASTSQHSYALSYIASTVGEKGTEADEPDPFFVKQSPAPVALYT
jgi:hypothetical protein